ncbi:MAG: signal peptidase I [Pelagibacterales bacterium]|nr:signal peptidase I [Pelagibacterales bacterium]
MNTILMILIIIVIIYLLIKEKMIEVFKTFIVAILIAVFLRSFAYEPFTIPSGSMKPNLLVGDFLFVSKFSYGYSSYSVPFGRYLPFNGRIFYSRPKRGDVAVFKFPGDNKTDYIKRIIGLPGDTVSVKDGEVYVNNNKLNRSKVGTFEDMHRNGYLETFHLIKESNNSGKEYLVLDDIGYDGRINSNASENIFDVNNTKNYTVPKDHFFVMGDNREHSSDSRILSQVGYVPSDNLVGKAAMIFLSVEYSNNYFKILGINFFKIPKKIRYKRIGHIFK